MPRVVSFIVLVAIILLIGVKFFQVMFLFIVPLFLAAVLVVIFKPLHLWMEQKLAPRKRLAALLTTLAIAVIILLPTVSLALGAAFEGVALITKGAAPAAQPNGEAPPPEDVPAPPEEAPAAVQPQEVPAGVQPDRRNDLAEGPEKETKKKPAEDPLDRLITRSVEDVNKLLEYAHIPYQMDASEVRGEIKDSLAGIAATVAVGGLKTIGGAVVGIAIMILSTYYFFADGPAMIETMMRMSPLDDQYERELLNKFSDLSRSVVLATLLSAVAQGALASIGYFFVGVNHLFLATVATAFFALVPFVGAAAIWGLVCVLLHYDGRTTAALLLMVYGVGVVSMVDNLIKPYILHGQANLHPLLACLSVIGGVQVLGPLGILVGPMLVAFLQALLNMLNRELHQMGQAKTLEKAISAEITTKR